MSRCAGVSAWPMQGEAAAVLHRAALESLAAGLDEAWPKRGADAGGAALAREELAAAVAAVLPSDGDRPHLEDGQVAVTLGSRCSGGGRY